MIKVNITADSPKDLERVTEQLLDDGTSIITIHPVKKEKVIWHGGCLNCKSQERFGLERCIYCKYQKPNWNLPDLNC